MGNKTVELECQTPTHPDGNYATIRLQHTTYSDGSTLGAYELVRRANGSRYAEVHRFRLTNEEVDLIVNMVDNIKKGHPAMTAQQEG